jgi:hypothetical protein
VDDRRIEIARRSYDVLEQRTTRETVQYLGQAGLHPLALACGEDDDVQRGHGERSWISLDQADVLLA